MIENKKCVLMKHGVYLFNSTLKGPCCYNQSGKINQSYDIDPIHCVTCLNEEKCGIQSYRQGANKQFGFSYDHRDIISLEITPNINCNLTCKICNEHSSSSWAKLKQIKLDSTVNVSRDKLYFLVENYNLSKLSVINFSGGEPFLNNNIVNYLQPLTDAIDVSNVTLRFSTNGTIFLNDKIINLFKKFKLVLARFSLDDVYEGHNYHRHPSNWEDWCNVWDHFLTQSPVNVIPSINRTVGILNLNRLHLLDDWQKQYQFSNVGDPIELINHLCHNHFSLNNITSNIKQYMFDKFGSNSIQWQFIQHIEPKDNIKHVTDYIIKMDTYHQQSFETYDPEMYSLLFK